MAKTKDGLLKWMLLEGSDVIRRPYYRAGKLFAYVAVKRDGDWWQWRVFKGGNAKAGGMCGTQAGAKRDGTAALLAAAEGR